VGVRTHRLILSNRHTIVLRAKFGARAVFDSAELAKLPSFFRRNQSALHHAPFILQHAVLACASVIS
jgi:hypothetical protein